MGVAISGLTAGTTLAEADLFEIEQSGVSKKITKTQLRSLMFSDPAFAVPAYLPKEGDIVSYSGTDFTAGAAPRWRVVPIEAYTEASVATTSTITFAGGADANGVKLGGTDYFAVGDPVRVVIGATTYYSICSAISDTELQITGAPLATSTAIASLSVGPPEMVRYVPIYVGKAAYAESVADLTAGTLRWRGRTGHLVAFSGAHETTGQPKINIKCNGLLVGTADSDKGIQLSATPGTFVDNPRVSISRPNYSIADAQNVVVRVTEAVASQDNLSMLLVFVVP